MNCHKIKMRSSNFHLKIIPVLLLIVAMSSTSAIACSQRTDLNELMRAQKLGPAARLVVYYDKSDLYYEGEKQENPPDAIGGLNIELLEYFARDPVRNKMASVLFSETRLIQNPMGEGYVDNYLKFRISENDTVPVIARYLDPRSSKVIIGEEFHTIKNKKKNNGGVYLYR